MGKMFFLAMTTVDGCISNLKGIKEWGLKRSSYGITEMYEKASAVIAQETSLREIIAIRENITGYCLYEATSDNGLTKQLFDNELVDELYLYVFSYTVGSGIPLFPVNVNVATYWKLEEAKVYNEEIVRLHYIKTGIKED